MIGRVVSHYRITERLSGGSMGVVYKAEDIGLQRTVALKFLSPELTRDTKARKRFTREARAASALDHPNICTVHEIDVSADGQTFIAMTFYEGDTLKQRMRQGEPVPVQDLLDVVEQVAAGLGKAHEQGIVHRDVKPANVLITSEGLVKLLDFGLAKQITGSSDYLTQSGFAMGTPTYMSPEQALGETVDSRSDQWSLAAIVYEALAGKPPFRGPSKMAVLFAIINRVPEPLSVACPDLPPQIDGALSRAMSKKPEDRYPTIGAFSEELKAILGQVESETLPVADVDPRDPEPQSQPQSQSQPPSGPQPESRQESRPPDEPATDQPVLQRPPPRGRWLAAGGLVALLAAVLAGILFVAGRGETPRISSTSPITRAAGLEQYPSFSPDGQKIAYVSGARGQNDIWIRDVDEDRGFPLTDAAGQDVYPVFSPDGDQIAFASDRDGGGIFVATAAAGGEARRLVRFNFEASESEISWIPTLAFSPDGRVLVFSGTIRSSGLFTVALDGGDPRQIPLPAELASKPLSQPAFSPDGRWLAFTELTGSGISVSTIWMLRVVASAPRGAPEPDGSPPVRVTDGRSFDHQPVFTADGRRLLFLSDRDGIADVYSVRLGLRGKPAGEAERVTVGIGIDSFALARSGTRLAYSDASKRTNIFAIVLGEEGPVPFDRARPLTAENHQIEHLDVSPDGEWIAFDSDRAGNMDLWIMRRDGSGLKQLTDHPARDWRPAFSPDGMQIAFYSLRGGNRDVYVMSADGEEAAGFLQLTDHPGMDWMPSFSPQGDRIVFGSDRAGSQDIWLVPANGGEPRQLTFGEADDRFAIFSPGGERLAFERSRDQRSEIFLLDLDGGEPVRLTRQGFWRIAPFAWSEDGATLYAHARRPGERPRLVAVALAGGEVRPLTDFTGPIEVFQSLAVDGSTVYFPLLERQGDLWLARIGE